MPGIKSAQGTLNEIRNGELMTEAAAAIYEGLAAVRQLGKPAKITIELTIAPQSKNLVEPIVTITGEVSTKLPKPDVPGTIFMIDDDGNATRNLSRAQHDLGLTIAKATQEG